MKIMNNKVVLIKATWLWSALQQHNQTFILVNIVNLKDAWFIFLEQEELAYNQC